MSQNPTVPKGKPEGDFKYVLFAGYRLGSAWPHKYIMRHTTVTSVDLEIPEWLPYLDLRSLPPNTPAMVAVHTRWPIQFKGRFVAGARVSAIFTNDKVVRDIVFHKGWVDVSDYWHKAEAEHLAALANPTPDQPGTVQAVIEIAARAIGRGKGRAAQPAS